VLRADNELRISIIRNEEFVRGDNNNMDVEELISDPMAA
jgi:hypothetical protein